MIVDPSGFRQDRFELDADLGGLPQPGQPVQDPSAPPADPAPGRRAVMVAIVR